MLRILVAAALAVFVYVLARRFRLIRLGQPDPRFSGLQKRFYGLIKDGFIQIRQPRYLAAGTLHIMIFWGFIILGLNTVDLLVGGLLPGFTFAFMGGGFGSLYTTAKDVAELTTLAAGVGALYRRIVVRPQRYQDGHRFEAYLVLVLIALLMITDLCYEGGRMLMAEPMHQLLPGAWIASRTMAFLDPAAIRMVLGTSYWLHIVLLLFFLNLLPFSKHFHIITALPNVFFRKPVRGRLKPITYRPLALEEMAQAGVGTIADFTWKQMLDFFSCTECGRCTDRCPVNRIGRRLSPKGITMSLRDQGYRTVPIAGRTAGNDHAPVVGEVVPDEELWNCTTCGACETECPVLIEHVDKIVDMRRHQVLMKSLFPEEFKGVFKKLETYGDTMGKGRLYREDWTSGLRVKRIYKDGPVDLLFWT
ncbi:MAG: (Fe-S)-binding protein, partial [Desulfobacterales bacterium]|nr:(Fe-S)-binding protein [Desulfobacterales bacterium]